jgi:hypothetical protein
MVKVEEPMTVKEIGLLTVLHSPPPLIYMFPMRCLLLIVMAIMFSGTAVAQSTNCAHSHDQNFSAEWFGYKDDDECIIATIPCGAYKIGSVAVNIHHMADVENTIRNAGDCTGLCTITVTRSAQARCDDSQCVIGN